MTRLQTSFVFLLLGLVAVGAADDLRTWDRYRVIVDRAPFGPIYKEGAPGFVEEQPAAPPAPPVPEGPKLSDIIRLSAITVFGGMPAAGFTDTTDNKSYYLYQGKGAGDYTLVEVRAATKSIVLRKGDQEEEIFVGGTPSEKPAATPPKTAARPPSPTRPAAAGQPTSYREAHQQRNEERQREIQARIEEATQRREEERARRLAEKQAEEERRAKNVENIINGGEGDPSIELNRAELEKLGEAGFDVSEPLRVIAENEAEEARRREESLPPRLRHREGESTEEYIKRIREEKEEAKRKRREGQAGTLP